MTNTVITGFHSKCVSGAFLIWVREQHWQPQICSKTQPEHGHPKSCTNNSSKCKEMEFWHLEPVFNRPGSSQTWPAAASACQPSPMATPRGAPGHGLPPKGSISPRATPKTVEKLIPSATPSSCCQNFSNCHQQRCVPVSPPRYSSPVKQ